MTVKTRVQAFGARLSGMIIPNLGAFMAWGILTAVGIAIANGTAPGSAMHEFAQSMRAFIVPMLFFLLPLLIAFAAGRVIHGYRGGVIATVATLGAIIGGMPGTPQLIIPGEGPWTVMFLGAMIMGPLAAWLLKKFDDLIDGKVPMGFELLVSNLTIGILGSILGLIAYWGLVPIIVVISNVLGAGVQALINVHLLPLVAFVIEPAKVVFLNNAIGQGVLTPLAGAQVAETGRSILFLLEANPGPGLGVLLAFLIFGKSKTIRATAATAVIIHFFGGIHEIYFPFILMKPILILPLIAAGLVGNTLFMIFDAALVSVASPGSIIQLSIMSAPGSLLSVWAGVFGAAIVSFFIAMPFIIRSKDEGDDLAAAAREMEKQKGKESRVGSLFKAAGEFDFAKVTTIIYACDAGIGSSAMGKSILQKKIKAAGLENDVKVAFIAVSDLPAKGEVIISHQSLIERAKVKQPDAYFIEITDFLNAPEYDDLVEALVKAKKGDEEPAPVKA